MRSILLSLLLSVVAHFSYANNLLASEKNYYGTQFLQAYENKNVDSQQLKEMLFLVTSGGHIKKENAPDEIVSDCSLALYNPNPVESSENVTQIKCVQHASLGYERARVHLFGLLHLKQRDSGEYFVKDVYCEKEFTDADFGQPTFGPNLKPSSGNIINTEHTWPQSRFTGRFPRELQKSDLHHLFPTDSQMNSARSSLRFGRIVEVTENLKCPQNKLGRQAEGDFVFEVPDSQKGNTARAIFYFAVRYQMRISPPEEITLREWHKLDPIDSEEIQRNSQIELLQGNRNPFIDFNDLLDHLGPF